jgi:hypothetical protein
MEVEGHTTVSQQRGQQLGRVDKRGREAGGVTRQEELLAVVVGARWGRGEDKTSGGIAAEVRGGGVEGQGQEVAGTVRRREPLAAGGRGPWWGKDKCEVDNGRKVEPCCALLRSLKTLICKSINLVQ